MLLAIDTSTAAVTVALGTDSGAVISHASVLDARRHGEVLAGLIVHVGREADVSTDEISEVLVGVGPGPFTGLRVGIVTASVFGFARGIPVTGVCSLDGLAHDAALAGVVPLGQEFLVATDARRKEVYWATYRVAGIDEHGLDAALAERREGPSVGRAAELGAPSDLPCVGVGPQLYPDDLRDAVEQAAEASLRQVNAGSLIRAIAVRRGAASESSTGIELPVEPLYLRRPDAVAPGPPKAVGPQPVPGG